MMNITSTNAAGIALVIFAHDESAVIEKSVRSARKELGSNDALLVIADHCSDDTALRARKAGAQVFIRENGLPDGKGAALGWFVRYHSALVEKFRMLVILDADSLVRPDFVRKINAHLSETDLVMQCFVCPIDYQKSPISTLIALSELVEQSVFDRIRSFLGWPIRMRGTGMVISPKVLLLLSDQVHTEVEDIALSLLLAERKIKVKRLDSVVVYDPKPAGVAAASRQRARWFRGQWAALWHYRLAVLKIALQGPGGWSLLGSLFLKPRWLMLAIAIGLACAFYRAPVIAGILGSLVLFDLILILSGIFRLKEKRTFLKAIFHLPEFVFMWTKSILLSFERSSWLRVRESEPASASGNFSQTGLVKSIKTN